MNICAVIVAGRSGTRLWPLSSALHPNEFLSLHGNEIFNATENLGDIRLELIEMQFGSYLGEDDIVKFEDKYGRV